MKKRILCILIMCCLIIITGCSNSRNNEEIEEIGNLINGTK